MILEMKFYREIIRNPANFAHGFLRKCFQTLLNFSKGVSNITETGKSSAFSFIK